MECKYFITSRRELYHYGVKGMKWGVRRYQNADGTLTPKGIERYRDNKSGMSKYAGMLGYDRSFPPEYKQDSVKEVIVPKNATLLSELKNPLDLDVVLDRRNREYIDDPDSAFEKHMRKVNKTNGVESGTDNNCTKVASAMCMAKMGYDYDAGRCMGGLAGSLSHWFLGEESSAWDNLGEAIQYKFSEAPNGSFGTVDMRNKNGGGHVFNWERNSRGEFSLYEGQCSEGEKYSGSSPEECFDAYITKRPWFSRDATVRVCDMTNAAPDFATMAEDSVVRITDDANYESKILDTITNKLYDGL